MDERSLQPGDLPLPWRGTAQNYNPDFIVADAATTHWVVEAKADKTAGDEDVRAKQVAATQDDILD